MHFSIDVLVQCYYMEIPHSQPGCHVIELLKSIGEELHHAGTNTALVVKQVSHLIDEFCVAGCMNKTAVTQLNYVVHWYGFNHTCGGAINTKYERYKLLIQPGVLSIFRDCQTSDHIYSGPMRGGKTSHLDHEGVR